jgi:hypothetical protein
VRRFPPGTARAVPIAIRERLQWREPDNIRRIANGEYAKVTKLDRHNIEAILDTGHKLSMPLSYARNADLCFLH